MKKVVFLLIAALLLGVGSATAQKKAGSKKAKAGVTAKAAKPRCFTGTYENHGNGMLVDFLALNVNQETGEVEGMFKDGNGVVTKLKGKQKGAALELFEAESNDFFDDATMYDGDTVKLSCFTGVFKRTSSEYKPLVAEEQPEVEKAGNCTLEEAAEKVRQATQAAGHGF